MSPVALDPNLDAALDGAGWTSARTLRAFWSERKLLFVRRRSDRLYVCVPEGPDPRGDANARQGWSAPLDAAVAGFLEVTRATVVTPSRAQVPED